MLWTLLEERRPRAYLLEVFRVYMYKGLSLTPFCRYFRLSQGSKESLFIGFEAFLFLRASHRSIEQFTTACN